MNAPLLYHCSPLDARLTVAGCASNATRARKAKKHPLGSAARLSALRVLETCPGCPGVLELARLTDEKPRAYDVAPAPEVSKRQQRRRIKPMRGRPGKGAVDAVSDSNTITVKEIAHRIRIAPSSVRQSLKNADIKPLNRSKRADGTWDRCTTFYDRDAVEAWIEKREVAPSTPPQVEESRRPEAAPATAVTKSDSTDLLQRIDAEIDEAIRERDTVTKRIEALGEARAALARVEELLGE